MKKKKLTNLEQLKRIDSKLARLVFPYLDELRQKNFSEETLRGRVWEILQFVNYCEDRAVTEPSQITVAFMERYRKFVTDRVSDVTGKRTSVVTQIHQLSTLRDYCRYLVRKGHMLFNPAQELELPRMGQRLPRNVLTTEEAERILMVPDITEPLGFRNRVILELLYSTGLRRSEASRLLVTDIDFTNGTVFVREGKGQKDRVIPVGERALSWLEKYLRNVRPALLLGAPGNVKDDGKLILSAKGTGLGREMITDVVTKARKQAGVEKKGSSHMFRHTTATLMLENGADVRYVQEMLGHKELSSTQIYTRVAIRKLKEVHEKTHPARFRKMGPEDDDGDPGDGKSESRSEDESRRDPDGIQKKTKSSGKKRGRAKQEKKA